MSGVIVDWERVTIIGRKPQKPKVTRKESDLNGMSFTGVGVTFTSAHHSTSDSVSEEVCSFDDALLIHLSAVRMASIQYKALNWNRA